MKKLLQQKKGLLIAFFITAIFIGILLFCFADQISLYVSKVRSWLEPERLQKAIDGLGFWGIFVLFLAQVLQIIIAFIPGEAVELVAGAMYGTWGGFVICMVGILVAQSFVFFMMRRYGQKLLYRFVKKEEVEKYQFLQSTEKLRSIVFVLFLIPGTPKDILTYVAGLSTIDMKSFLILSIVARIPSVITSTLAGSQFGSGDYSTSIIIFLATAVIGLLGIELHKRFMKKIADKEETEQKSSHKD